MKLNRNLKKQTLPVSHSMNLLHAVKNGQCQVGSTLDMVFSSGITFGNVPGCHQNIIFEIVCTLDKILLFPEVIGNTVKKRYTRHPQRFCIEKIHKVLTDDHSRHNESCILRINVHLLCQKLLCLIDCVLIALLKLCFCENIILSLFPENGLCKEISHKNHILNVPVLQVKALKACQVIADKFLYQLCIVGVGFLQLFQTLADTHASHFQALGSNKRILVKQGDLQVSASYVQNGCSLLDHFLEAVLNGCDGLIAKEMLFCIA